MRESVADGLAAAGKSSIALGVVGATIFGYTLQEAVAILGGVFILMQMAHFVYLRLGEWKAKRAASAAFKEKIEAP